MRAALIALAAVATLSSLATPAVAQSAADRADTRCLLVLQLVARDPKAREQATKGAYYFMGRLGARGSPRRLEPVIISEARSINSGAVAKAELDRCAGELNQTLGRFKVLDQALAAVARPATPPAKAP